MKFRFYHQSSLSDCGPACLKMIALHYGRNVKTETLRHLSGVAKDGVNLLGISEAAEKIGFSTTAARLTTSQLIDKGTFPFIAYWQQNHFVVVIKKIPGKWLIADPAKGIRKITEEEFNDNWLTSPAPGVEEKGIGLFLRPEKEFFARKNDTEPRSGWPVLIRYLAGYKKYVYQVLLGLLIISLLQLFFPILTKLIIDNGIEDKNIRFIYVVVIAQFVLMFSRTVAEFLRSRVLLFISTRISLTILSDFWTKMLNLPLSYYDTKMSGDVMQRIGDQKRIENFLTGSTLNILFSIITLLLFSILFLLFNWKIYLVFLFATILYFLWIKFFLQARRKLDFERFDTGAEENAATIEMIQGVQDIKLYNAENYFRWKWEDIQVKASRLSFKGLTLNQWQETGALFLNEGKNIVITLIAATAVVNQEMSLGTLVAMQYILGQVSAPVEQIVNFTQYAQDASISLERFAEINAIPDEEDTSYNYTTDIDKSGSIQISNLSFTYPGAGNEPVLKNFSLTIPGNKVTAIVGMSGNGKSTLLKLLLKFYQHYEGEITIGHAKTPFHKISPRRWRNSCGSVLQDSYIFNESIKKNIAVGENAVDEDRLTEACRIANILEYIQSLPLQFETKIGLEGNGISGGQKQRILIARAVYQNPSFLFFDEATNSLDANNENIILQQLQSFFTERTVVIVAHRMSTIRNADKIVVIENGEVAEEGNHQQLLDRKGYYYKLIKMQMDTESTLHQ